MEGSGAGLAAAPAQGPANGDGEAAAQPTPDLGALTTQLDKIGETLESQREYLQSEPWKPEPAPVEPEPPDFGFLDETQPGFTPEQAAKQLQSIIETAAQEKANAVVTPIQEQLHTLQLEQQSQDLLARYPQMADNEVAQVVIDHAHQFAEAIGKPELAANPQVWEMVYLAGRANEQAQQEDQSPPSATLMGAGGASPGGAPQGEGPTTESVMASMVPQRLPLFGGSR